MSICFIENKQHLFVHNQQTTSLKILQCHANGIFCRSPSETTRITLEDSSIGIYFFPPANNTPSSPPSRLGSKIKALPEGKYDDELPAGIGYDSSFYTLVIDDVLPFSTYPPVYLKVIES